MRRQYQTVIIGVSHDKSTHQAGRYTPGSSPHILQLILFIDKLHIECLGKVLPQEVGSTALQSLTILHHRLNGISIERTGKTFVSWLHTFHNRHCHILFGKFTVYIQHSYSFFFGLFASGVCRMAFLPQEFRRTQEETGTHLPTEYVCPLIAQDRQIAVWINPVLICIPDNGFGSRTDNEFFFQLSSRVYYHATAIRVVFQTIVRHYGTFFRKTFYMLCFTAKEWFRNK